MTKEFVTMVCISTGTHKVEMWVRWSHTRYTDRKNGIGPAGEIITGYMRNDVKFTGS